MDATQLIFLLNYISLAFVLVPMSIGLLTWRSQFVGVRCLVIGVCCLFLLVALSFILTKLGYNTYAINYCTAFNDGLSYGLFYYFCLKTFKISKVIVVSMVLVLLLGLVIDFFFIQKGGFQNYSMTLETIFIITILILFLALRHI